jgi:nucleotide-binding universal stress UspA family protein
MLVADLQDSLRQAAAPLQAPSRIVDTKVVRGRPASALLEEAAALQPDVLVIGTRGHGPLATILLGSVSAEIVDHAPCPVLVARGSSVQGMVVAVDGSESAQRAVATLSGWPVLRSVPARVVAVTVPPPTWAVSVEATFYPSWVQLRDSATDALGDELAKVATAACQQLTRSGFAVSVELRDGDPAAQLIHAAQEAHADLIVVGSRGLSALPRLVLGSTARSVVLHAPVSVLVVREPRERVKSAEPIPAKIGSAAPA